MNRDQTYFLLLNIGHFLDHLFMLVFATVAALALHREWGVSYGELLAYATPGFFAFGLFSLPAGWLADRWSRAKRTRLRAFHFVTGGLAEQARRRCQGAAWCGRNRPWISSIQSGPRTTFSV